MNKKTQKIVSISIGLILSILIVVIGFRLMQRSGAQAAPGDLGCDRDKSVAVVEWTDGNSSLGTVVYGSDDSTSLPFLAQEEDSPADAGIGQYKHKVKIGPLPAGTSYSVAVEGFTSQSSPCIGDDGTEPLLIDTSADTGGGLDELLESANEEEDFPEEPDEPEPTEIPEPAFESQSLPLVQATEYFSDNPDDYIDDCVNNFKFDTDSNGNRYTGLSSTCSAAWTNVNLSN